VTYTVIYCGILEIKKAYINWRRAPLAVLLPNIFTAFSAAECTAGLQFLAGDKFLGNVEEISKGNY